MPKIALLGHFFGPKLGVGVFIDRFISHLDPELTDRHRVTFFTNANTQRNLTRDTQHIDIRCVPELDHSSLRAAAWVGLRFPSLVEAAGYDVAVILTNPIVRKTAVPTISVIHDLNEFAMPQKFSPLRSWYRRNLMIRGAVRNSDGIVVISRFVQRQLRQYFPDLDPQTTVRVIPNGVDIHDADVQDEAAVLSRYDARAEHYFLVVGRIDPVGKNLDGALRVFRRLEQRKPGMKLLLAGGINRMCEQAAGRFLEQIRNDAFLSERVRHIGFVPDDDLAVLYRHAAGLLFMSPYEGFGFPMIEAFKAGCPVIYNRACEVLNDHAEGAAIAVDESAAELPAQCDVLFDSKKRMQLQQRMKHVAKQYDWSRTARAYLDFITDVAQGRG